MSVAGFVGGFVPVVFAGFAFEVCVARWCHRGGLVTHYLATVASVRHGLLQVPVVGFVGGMIGGPVARLRSLHELRFDATTADA
jgi:hypothetical protein